MSIESIMQLRGTPMDMDDRYRFHRDRHGAAQIPLQLVISIIVAASVVSLVYQVMDGYRKNQVDNEIQTQISSLGVKLDQVWTGGNGTSLSHTINIPDGIDYLDIGGTLAPGDRNNYTIRFRPEGQGERLQLVKCPLTSIGADGQKRPLRLGPGSHDLLLIHVVSEFFEGPEYVKVQL